MPTVLHILPALPFGGLQKLATDLAAEQRARGHDARILTLYEDAHCEAYIQQHGLPYQCTPGQHVSMLGCAEYAHAIRTTRPDLVHLHGGVLWSNLIALPLKRCPWVYHAHSYMAAQATLKTRLVYQCVHQLCDAYIGISNFVTDLIRPEAGHTPLYTVYNGIRVPDHLPPVRVPSKAPCYGVATRIDRSKGVLEFVDVAAAIAARQPDARFRLAGEGPLKAQVIERVRRRGLSERFELVGFVQDVDAFYRGLDVVVSTSPRETFGLGIVEPMALGIPVVAYINDSGSDEIIEHGANGLQAPWNDADTLASHAIRLARNTDERKTIIHNAFAVVQERFSLRAMADGVDAVYADLLGLQPASFLRHHLPELHVS